MSNEMIEVPEFIREKIPDGFEVARETAKVYTLKNKDGQIKYICKKCGHIMNQALEISRHVCSGSDYLDENDEEDEELDFEFEEDNDESFDDTSFDDTDISLPTSPPKTPDEEEIDEQAVKLYKLLSVAPGVKDKKRVKWVCSMFKENEELRNEYELAKYLKKQFPKLDEISLKYIVKQVLGSKRNDEDILIFEREKNIDMPPMIPQQPEIPQIPEPPESASFAEKMLFLLFKQYILPQMGNNGNQNNNGTNIEMLQKEFNYKLELLKKEMELKHMKQLLKEKKSNNTLVGRTEYDVASTLVEGVLDIGRRFVDGITRISELLTAIVIGKRHGMTDDDIYRLVKSENPDYVDEEI